MSQSFPDEWMQEAFPIPGLDDGAFNQESLEEIFKEIDLDKKGHISKADLRHLMNMIGEKVDETDIDEMMRLVDPENTGSVTSEQFIESFMYPSALFYNPVR